MLNATDATQVTFLGEFISRGRRWNAYSDGTVLPVIAGGDGTAGDPPAGGAPAGGAPAGGPPAGYVPQETVNATVLRETEKAKNDAQAELLAKLGVSSVEDAERLLQAQRDAEAANMTEAQRAASAWKTAQAAAEQIAEAAKQERHDAAVERALQRAGLDVENAVLLAAGLAAVAGQVQVGADADAIKAAVEKAKTDAPQLFTSTPGGGGQQRHTDPGHQRKDPAAPTGEFGEQGAAEAARRFGTEREKQPA